MTTFPLGYSSSSIDFYKFTGWVINSLYAICIKNTQFLLILFMADFLMYRCILFYVVFFFVVFEVHCLNRNVSFSSFAVQGDTALGKIASALLTCCK